MRVNPAKTAKAGGLGAIGLLLLAVCTTVQAEVLLEMRDGGVDVRIDGELFTHYNFDGCEFPFFYPLNTPDGVNITRHWPMADGGRLEERDHRHHRSLWFAHGDVNGFDFWTYARQPDIVQTAIVSMHSGEDEGRLTTENEWRDDRGVALCKDTRRYRFGAEDEYRFIDFSIEIEATDDDLLFGDSKEGCMAVRVAPQLRLKGRAAEGHILMQDGIRDDQAWGKRSAWCYYYGPIEGQIYGVAIVDHPGNLRHPTWWHARDYGLCAANPFGISHFDKGQNETGDHKVMLGETLALSYRIIISKGQLSEDELDRLYKQYSRY